MAIFYGVPVTKFLVHLISYVSFLILFSMYFLFYRPTDGKGNTGQRIYEWVLATIWFSYYVDMVQNLVTVDASWAMKLRLWLQSEWSVLDFCYLHLALASFALNGVFPDYVKGYVKVKSDQGPQTIDIYTFALVFTHLCALLITTTIRVRIPSRQKKFAPKLKFLESIHHLILVPKNSSFLNSADNSPIIINSCDFSPIFWFFPYQFNFFAFNLTELISPYNFGKSLRFFGKMKKRIFVF